MKLFYLAFLWSILAVPSQASTLTMVIRFDRQSYQIGDTLRCSIIFKNTSGQSIRLLPKDTIYPAAELHFESVRTGQVGELVRLGEASIDIEESAKEVVLLHPGASYTRKLKAEVRSTFRDSYRDNRRGLILDFPGSAVLLSGFGKYKVDKTFKERSDDFVAQYLSQGPKLWQGKIKSAPVIIEFKP